MFAAGHWREWQRCGCAAAAGFIVAATGASIAHAQLPEPPPSFLFSFAPRGEGPDQVSEPRGLAVAQNGDLYVADSGNNRIHIFDAAGHTKGGWGRGGDWLGQFNFPTDVALDHIGNVYVADTFNARIQVFSPTGTLLRVFHYGYGFGLINSIDVKNDEIFALDVTYNRVLIFDLYGQPPDFQRAPIPTPYGGDTQHLAVDEQANIYMLSLQHATVTKCDWQGHFVTEWGGPGSGPGEFDSPVGIETDAAGDVYVADRNNHRIQKFNSQGTLLSMWGSEGSGSGQFHFVGAIGVGADGHIFVAQSAEDPLVHCIQVFGRTVSVTAATWSDIKAKYR